MAKGRVGFERSAAWRMVLASSRRSSGLLWEKFEWFLNSVVRLKWKLMSVAKMVPITILRSSCTANPLYLGMLSLPKGHKTSKNRPSCDWQT